MIVLLSLEIEGQSPVPLAGAPLFPTPAAATPDNLSNSDATAPDRVKGGFPLFLWPPSTGLPPSP